MQRVHIHELKHRRATAEERGYSQGKYVSSPRPRKQRYAQARGAVHERGHQPVIPARAQKALRSVRRQRRRQDIHRQKRGDAPLPGSETQLRSVLPVISFHQRHDPARRKSAQPQCRRS